MDEHLEEEVGLSQDRIRPLVGEPWDEPVELLFETNESREDPGNQPPRGGGASAWGRALVLFVLKVVWDFVRDRLHR